MVIRPAQTKGLAVWRLISLSDPPPPALVYFDIFQQSDMDYICFDIDLIRLQSLNVGKCRFQTDKPLNVSFGYVLLVFYT